MALIFGPSKPFFRGLVRSFDPLTTIVSPISQATGSNTTNDDKNYDRCALLYIQEQMVLSVAPLGAPQFAKKKSNVLAFYQVIASSHHSIDYIFLVVFHIHCEKIDMPTICNIESICTEVLFRMYLSINFSLVEESLVFSFSGLEILPAERSQFFIPSSLCWLAKSQWMCCARHEEKKIIRQMPTANNINNNNIENSIQITKIEYQVPWQTDQGWFLSIH